jgi:hypothetical protein
VRLNPRFDSGEKRMIDARRFAAVTGMLLGLCAFQPVEAQSFELTGAWASQADLCKLVFTKKGNQVVFAEMSDLFGSGFIVDGSRIRGKSAQCAIKSKKQEGDGLELDAACATSIMNQSVHFSLKIIDDNSLSRSFREIPEMSLKYSRCSI